MTKTERAYQRDLREARRLLRVLIAKATKAKRLLKQAAK